MAQSITPFLWFEQNAKEAADYYVSVFPNSKILSTSYYPKTKDEGLADFQKDMAGKELVVEFELNNVKFSGLNGGPFQKFNEAVSFSIVCRNQEEIDFYWSKLSKVPEAEQCGWCKDQFGLSWQVVPDNVTELLKRPGAFARMMNMKKLVIAEF